MPREEEETGTRDVVEETNDADLDIADSCKAYLALIFCGRLEVEEES